MTSPLEVLRAWHDFYALIGTAAATLVGLMFVAASIGAGVFTSAHQAGIRSFLSPTVVHFSLVLVLCLIASAPIESVAAMRLCLVSTGLIGFAYSGSTWWRMRYHGMSATIDLADRILYALLPLAVYLVLVGSGLAIPSYAVLGSDLLALACLALLLVGIRNAWDMTVWIIGRRQQ